MRGHSSIRLQRGLQPFADLGADGAGMDVVDFNAVLVFAGHDKPFAAIALPTPSPERGIGSFMTAGIWKRKVPSGKEDGGWRPNFGDFNGIWPLAGRA